MPTPERVLGARVLHHDGAVAALHQVADLQVDLLGGQVGGVELGPLVEIDVGASG
jgi:hypothetical protein